MLPTCAAHTTRVKNFCLLLILNNSLAPVRAVPTYQATNIKVDPEALARQDTNLIKITGLLLPEINHSHQANMSTRGQSWSILYVFDYDVEQRPSSGLSGLNVSSYPYQSGSRGSGQARSQSDQTNRSSSFRDQSPPSSSFVNTGYVLADLTSL